MRCTSVVLVKSPLLLALATLAWAQQIPQQVAILRQINHVNDDGSYTYGYEAADGSFKIETRDVTGTVRGMFGFVDESGRQRRVSYTAGNSTGFQTTGEPPSDASPTPPPQRLLPEQPVLRPVRPLPTAPSGHRDSVAKLIRHLGIIGAKQAGSHRFLYSSEGSSTSTASPVTTTSTTPDSKREEDQPTTRRPTVVQRIVRTRPRSDSRKYESNTSSSRRQGETSTVASTTEKQEVEVKDESTPAPPEVLQKRPVVALKVADNPGSPRFVILPSRLLRWQPEDHDGKAGVEREGDRPEPLIRQHLATVPVQKDNFRYRLRQLPREQLAAPQTPLQIFAQKSELPPNFQNQQFLPQKNVFAFLSTTPRPRLSQSRSLPVSPSVHPDTIPGMYRQAYDLSESPNGVAKVIFNDGNYTPKSQHVPQYVPQHQIYYQQRPLPYSPDPNRYGPYYPKPNPYPPSIQGYPVYGQMGLIELILAYLQHQPKSSPPQGEYANQLPYDPRSVVPRPHYPQENSGFQPPAIFIPFPAPIEPFPIPYNNVAPVPSNYELARLFDQRPILRPTIIRQPIDVQDRIQRPPVYGSGLHLPYVKNKDVLPVNLYIDPRNVNFRQGIALRPAPLQLQPLYVETARSHASTHPLDYPIHPARQGPPVSVTTVSPRSAIQTPPSSENQGLPYGFTKKFRSVEVIAPETDTPAQKNSKSD